MLEGALAYQEKPTAADLASMPPGLEKAALLRKYFQHKFSPVLVQLNILLSEANKQGIDVKLEIVQGEGCLGVFAIAGGVASPAGRLLAQRRGLIP